MDKVIEKLEVEKKLIHVDDVAKLIGKASTTIRTFSTKNGCEHLIPRPFKMPNSRRLCWYEHEVIEWIESKKMIVLEEQTESRSRDKKVSVNGLKTNQLTGVCCE